MKRSLLFLSAIILISCITVDAQGLLKKVQKSMTDELLGKPQGSDTKSNQPEPASACENPGLVMDMGGKLKLDYKELTVSISVDGRILAKDAHADQYYIVENGVTTGPLKPGDKRLKGFESVMNNTSGDDTDSDTNKNPWLGNPYITKSGDKFLINFGGKSYGPYAQISSFAVPKSKDKFAAIVVENIVVTEDEGKAMDEAIKNAKTDQEKMELAMKYSQQMQQKIIDGGGPGTMMGKLVTNIPGATYDPNNGGSLSGKIKYDDILIANLNKVVDLKGKTIATVKDEYLIADNLFVNSDNSGYAIYQYGTIAFNDNTTLAECFNPQLVKEDGKIWLAYMYYSPKRNSIMQCKIPF